MYWEGVLPTTGMPLPFLSLYVCINKYPHKIEFSELEGGAKMMIRDDISFLAPGKIVVFISFQKLKRV